MTCVFGTCVGMYVDMCVNPLIVTTPPPVETMLYGEPKDTTGESNVNIASDVPEKDVICIRSCCCLVPSNFASTEIA